MCLYHQGQINFSNHWVDSLSDIWLVDDFYDQLRGVYILLELLLFQIKSTSLDCNHMFSRSASLFTIPQAAHNSKKPLCVQLPTKCVSDTYLIYCLRQNRANIWHTCVWGIVLQLEVCLQIGQHQKAPVTFKDHSECAIHIHSW